MTRTRAFFALIVLLVGQFHLCRSECVRPVGDDCSDCTSVSLEGLRPEKAIQASSPDCCEVKSCHETPKDTSDFLAAPLVRIAVLSPFSIDVLVPDRLVLPDRFWVIDASPPHAPPPSSSSRAPPVQLS